MLDTHGSNVGFPIWSLFVKVEVGGVDLGVFRGCHRMAGICDSSDTPKIRYRGLSKV